MKAFFAKTSMMAVSAVITTVSAEAFTELDYVQMGKSMVAASLADDVDDMSEMTDCQSDWISWDRDGFFDHFVTNGWTRSMCEMAFDKYLASISTNDMSMFDDNDKWLARGALGQCADMNYTNALDTIRLYAVNTTAVDRTTAVETAVRLAEVDKNSAAFIELLVTNNTLFSYSEINWVIPIYCDRLLKIETNDNVKVSIRNRCARLFYANRMSWPDGIVLDNLFVASFPEYDYSSNRLNYANHILSWTTNNYWSAMHNHFISVTNDLLSSGRPLVELSVPSPE